MPPATRPSSSATRRCWRAASCANSAGPSCAARWRPARRPSRRWACSAATASARSCPTCPRPSSSSWPCASLGAIWSVCSPDMGPVAVLDRFRQIEPKLLVACDGYRYGGERARPARAAGAAAGRAAQRAPRGAVAQPRRLAADLAGAGAPGARPGRAAGRRRAVRAGVAALRPPAVGGVFQRHHRAAQAHRARPRRRHARGAEDGRAAQRRRPQRAWRGDRFHWYSQHRLDHVEQPGRRAARRHHDLHLRRQPGRAARRAGLGHAVALCRPGALHLLRRRRGLLRVVPEGRRRAAGGGRPVGAARGGLHRLAAVRASATAGSGTSCPRWTGSDIWLTPISGGTDFAGAFIGGLPTLPVVEARCSAAASAPRSRPGPSPMQTASASR